MRDAVCPHFRGGHQRVAGARYVYIHVSSFRSGGLTARLINSGVGAKMRVYTRIERQFGEVKVECLVTRVNRRGRDRIRVYTPIQLSVRRRRVGLINNGMAAEMRVYTRIRLSVWDRRRDGLTARRQRRCVYIHVSSGRSCSMGGGSFAAGNLGGGLGMDGVGGERRGGVAVGGDAAEVTELPAAWGRASIEGAGARCV
jgi:hypothetical protein